jgi:hypothetical protein
MDPFEQMAENLLAGKLPADSVPTKPQKRRCRKCGRVGYFPDYQTGPGGPEGKVCTFCGHVSKKHRLAK